MRFLVDAFCVKCYDEFDQVKFMRITAQHSIFLLTLSALVSAFLFLPINSVQAQETTEVPIVFESSEPVTAAEFNVAVTGGTLVSLKCGGDGFQSLDTNNPDKCIVFNPSSATSGTIGVATVRSNGGQVTVTPDGTFSTAEGVEPSQSTIRGTDYTTGGNTTTSTPNDSQAIFMFIVIALVLVVIAILAAYFFLHKKESSTTL